MLMGFARAQPILPPETGIGFAELSIMVPLRGMIKPLLG
jgi:hypothetical protein